ncbi:hypothetical protein ACHWQZ_G005209 [Mnemiopsis leidyi]
MWEHSDHSGDSKTLYGGHNDFRAMIGRWNDVVSSVRASGESWELYTHVNYEGDRMVVQDGQSLNVDHNDRYSSARPTCEYYRNPDTEKLRVYEHNDLQGEMREFLTDCNNVGDYWNDKISSVYAVKGDWEIYQHFDFEGKREMIWEGQSNNLRHNDHASSMRPLCSTYKMTCKLSKIKVIDDGQVKPTFAGTEIIGSQVGGSCSGPSPQTLTLSSGDSVKESTTIELSWTDEINWSATTSVTVEASAKFLGSRTRFTAGVTLGYGGVRSITSTNFKSFNNGNEEVSIAYNTPGAALVYGTVDRFTIKNTYVPVDMGLECPDRTTRTRRTTVRINTVTYPTSQFWPLYGQFGKKACDKDGSLPLCVTRVRRKYMKDTKEVIKKAFDACFDSGKGKVVNLANLE